MTGAVTPHIPHNRPPRSPNLATGTAQAAENAEPGWSRLAEVAIATLAENFPTEGFTVADLKAYMADVEPDHPCRWGAAFASAQARGIIEVIGAELDPWTQKPVRRWGKAAK